jgi:hypothetical protein
VRIRSSHVLGRRIAWALAAPILLQTTSAVAQSAAGPDAAARRAARAIATEGIQLLQSGQYAQAQQRLRRAWELYPAPTVALFEGEALEKMGKLVEAAERYEAAKLAEVPHDAHSALKAAAARAGEELARITPLIPKLVVRLEGAQPNTPGLELRLDGEPLAPAVVGVERPVNPGVHEVVALYAGQVQARHSVRVDQGQTEQVRLVVSLPETPAAPAAAPPPTRSEPAPQVAPAPVADATQRGSVHRSTGWVSLGVGVAGLATGVACGVMMLKKDSELEDHCPGGQCPGELEDELNAFTTYRIVSMVGYGVGIVGLGVGAALLLTAPSAAGLDSSGAVVPWIGTGRVGLRGRF